MNTELTQLQIDELKIEVKKAKAQPEDAKGAYASTYAMILGFIVPSAPELDKSQRQARDSTVTPASPTTASFANSNTKANTASYPVQTPSFR